MRILFLSQLLPLPLDAGPKIRAYYVLRYLVEAGHSVKLLSFTRPGDSNQDIDQLRRICSTVETVPLVRSRFKDLSHGLHSLFSTTPFLILRDHLLSMRKKLTQIAANCSFDAIHADQLWMSPYIMDHPGPALKVLDQHNAVFMIPRRLADHEQNRFRRMVLQKEASKLQTFEGQACRDVDRVVWVNEADRRALGFSADRLTSNCVIPIATDPSVRSPVKRQRPFRVTFIGGLHWPPNLEGVSWFVDKVWPKVARAAQFSVLTLIGKGAPRKLFQEKDDSRIEVTGYVTDLEKYLRETAVFIVPLRSGAGMRVKILDAWCWGMPVVSTSMGAEGIAIVPGENLLIADDEESFADCLLRVVQNNQLARQLSENGRSTVGMLYDWREVYKAWDQIYH